jgi:transposase InsO family protein
MMKQIHPQALFRLSVLGPLASRDHLERGELKVLVRELAAQSYAIPNSKRVYLSEKTIESWYYAWKSGGIEALTPQVRVDHGQSKLPEALQEAVLAAKKEQPGRSLSTILELVQRVGVGGANEASRSSIHRLLQSHGLSAMTGSAALPVERRSFVAAHAGDVWYGDVMHGPKIPIQGRMRKSYLISFMDDASRLIAHSAFCPAETALEVEGMLKQAILKRGLPKRLVIDNGAAYRAASLQGICARLEIRLVYCRPYSPEGKGKLERWHRTLRNRFLNELDLDAVRDLHDLNARLWAWLEESYHHTSHRGLDGLTPLERYRQDLIHIRPLGAFASHLDELFQHRYDRLVRKDGTVSYDGKRFEVPFELTGRTVTLVVEPQTGNVVAVESAQGKLLGLATLLDPLANIRRKRRTALPGATGSQSTTGINLVELTLKQHQDRLGIADPQEEV